MRRLLWLASSIALAACDGALNGESTNSVTTDTRETRETLIHTAAPMATELSQLNLFLPRLGSQVTGAVTFRFDTTASPQGMLLLFSRKPEMLVNGRLPSGLAANGCLGGIVSMAGMTWNGVARLDSLPHLDGFHACTASEHEPIDPNRPITLDALSGLSEIWWVVVGYDKGLVPVATSPVYRFKWSKQ